MLRVALRLQDRGLLDAGVRVQLEHSQGAEYTEGRTERAHRKAMIRVRWGGLPTSQSQFADWFSRVHVLAWVFRKLSLLFVHSHWEDVFLVGDSGTVGMCSKTG